MWQSDIRFKKLKIGRWLLAGAICAILGLTLFGSQGFFALLSAQQEIKNLRKEITLTQHSIDSLKNYISELQTDTFAIEQAARERLGMAKKNEVIYKFIEN